MLPPYKLPIFVPMIVLTLEFSRQRMNIDEINFVPRKKKVQF